MSCEKKKSGTQIFSSCRVVNIFGVDLIAGVVMRAKKKITKTSHFEGSWRSAIGIQFCASSSEYLNFVSFKTLISSTLTFC